MRTKKQIPFKHSMSHVDFDGWQFISRPQVIGEPGMDEQYLRADKNRPIVCFGSFQDLLGVNKETGGIKAHNEWVHMTNWDLVIFDEYHFFSCVSSSSCSINFQNTTILAFSPLRTRPPSC